MALYNTYFDDYVNDLTFLLLSAMLKLDVNGNGGGMIKVQVVEDEVTRFVRRWNEWLDDDENVDWLLPRAVAVIFAVVSAVLFGCLLFF